jgi:hypothetical protein
VHGPCKKLTQPGKGAKCSVHKNSREALDRRNEVKRQKRLAEEGGKQGDEKRPKVGARRRGEVIGADDAGVRWKEGLCVGVFWGGGGGSVRLYPGMYS